MYISEVFNDKHIELIDAAAVAERLIKSNCIGTAHIPLARATASASRLLALRLDVIQNTPIISGDFFYLKDPETVSCQMPKYSLRSASFLQHTQTPSRLIVIAEVSNNSEALPDHSVVDRVLLSFDLGGQEISNLVYAQLSTLGIHYEQTLPAAVEVGVFRHVSIDFNLSLPNSPEADLAGDIIRDLFRAEPERPENNAWRDAMQAAGIKVVGAPRELTPDLPLPASAYGFAPALSDINLYQPDSGAGVDQPFGIHPLDFNFFFPGKDASRSAKYPTLAYTLGFDAPPGSGPVRRAAVFFAMEIFERSMAGKSVATGSKEQAALFRRLLVYSIMHEFGHMLNLFHPWERDLQQRPRLWPDATDVTWTNYGYYFPFGAMARILRRADEAAYDANRHARMERFLETLDAAPGYSPEEVVHIRHERHAVVAPGPVALATAHNHRLGTESKPDNSNNLLKDLELSLDFGGDGGAVTATRYSPMGFTADEKKRAGECGWETNVQTLLYPFVPFGGVIRLRNHAQDALAVSGDVIRNQFGIQTGALRLIIQQERSRKPYYHTQGPTLVPDVPEPAAFLGFGQKHELTEEVYDLPPLRPDLMWPTKAFTLRAALILPPYGYIESDPIVIEIDRTRQATFTDPIVFQLLRDPYLLQLHYAAHEYASVLKRTGKFLGWIETILTKIDQARPAIDANPDLNWIGELADLMRQRMHFTLAAQKAPRLTSDALQALIANTKGQVDTCDSRVLGLSVLNATYLKYQDAAGDSVQVDKVADDFEEAASADVGETLQELQDTLCASRFAVPEVEQIVRARHANLQPTGKEKP
ncbi:MAG: hypothetical protein AAGP08_03225 [Pseudomonadota bacterium]